MRTANLDVIDRRNQAMFALEDVIKGEPDRANVPRVRIGKTKTSSQSFVNDHGQPVGMRRASV